jgi:hypothetical protein
MAGNPQAVRKKSYVILFIIILECTYQKKFTLKQFAVLYQQ